MPVDVAVPLESPAICGEAFDLCGSKTSATNRVIPPSCPTTDQLTKRTWADLLQRLRLLLLLCVPVRRKPAVLSNTERKFKTYLNVINQIILEKKQKIAKIEQDQIGSKRDGVQSAKKYKVKQGAGNTNNADDRSGLPT